MAAYAFIDVHIHDIGDYMDFMREVRPLIEAAGGRYLVRGGETHVYEGDYQPSRLVLLEFPSMEALDQFYSSEAHLALVRKREHCSDTRLVALDGLREPPPAD